MSDLFIGVDPGKDGYICINFEDKIEFKSMPKIGKEFDIRELSKIFDSIYGLSSLSNKVYCVLEDVHAIFGASAGATFEFGFGLGLLEGMLVSCEIPYSKIQPKKWQKQMFEGVSEQRKPSSTGKTMKVDTKAMAEIAAKRMFPEIDLRASERCKKSHDGKVDALLLCEYAKRNFK